MKSRHSSLSHHVNPLMILSAASQVQVARSYRRGLFAALMFYVEVRLCCTDLESSGPGFDADWLRTRLREVLRPLQQQRLDQHPVLQHKATTADVARHICEGLLEPCDALVGDKHDGSLQVVVKQPRGAWGMCAKALGASRAR